MSITLTPWHGQKIDRPGAYIGVPMEVYHGDPCVGPSISSSGLRRIFTASLRHYWDSSVYNPNREEMTSTDAMVLGRAAHHLLLGEESFSSLYIVRPEEAPDGRAWNMNNKTCKEWVAAREAEGLTVLKPSQVEQIRGISTALAAEPMIQGGCLSGLIEVSFFWQDDETGIWCKARPDAVPEDSLSVFDLKVTGEIGDDELQRNLSNHGYHQQGALVDEAFTKIFGLRMTDFSLVYAESTRPHCVRIERIIDEDIDLGHKANRAALRAFAWALKNNEWPGPKSPTGDVGNIRLAPWARTRAEARATRMLQEFPA
ncbi:hypothetical protein [Pleomorphomonas sp. PLEO]|uniref:PD-(D/E)XK nuclease-like domain-containing protein n=1 Tax=Pleomorphomonas sp. PLEO TaxID=3239306 RepID=UPI00351EE8E1